MPFYESVFIARQDIAAPQAEALGETFAGIVAAAGGNVTKREYWGLRNLSYKIKKNRKGHYLLLNIEGDGPAVAELERNMRIHEDVLRYLTVRVDALEDGPSAMLRSRGQDDERPRGGRFGADRPRGPRRDGPHGRDGGRDESRPRRDAAEPSADQGETA